MKVQSKYQNIIKVVIGFFLFCFFYQNINAQNSDKNSVRLQGYYTKIVDSFAFVDIKATSKINKKNVRVPNIEISVYNELSDEKIKLGSAITNNEGEIRFIIQNLNLLKPDSTNTYNLELTFKGNKDFKKASKSINFQNATIEASLNTKDNINYLTINLTNEDTKSPIINESIYVQVQRLFRPLRISDTYKTDEEGSVIIPIESGIPGVNGIIDLEIVLYESDNFGTVKNIVSAPIGVPIVDESTFDQRTMWSPRNKTPLFLLIVPNVLTFCLWGFILYFIINLFKIKNSST